MATTTEVRLPTKADAGQVFAALADAHEKIDDLATLVFVAAQGDEPEAVTSAHVGELVYFLRDAKWLASSITASLAAIEQTTLVDLAIIAAEGQQPNMPCYTADGRRNPAGGEW